MISIIRPVIPNLSPISGGNALMLINWLMITVLAALSALFIARYSADRFKTDKKKTVAVYIALAVIMSVMMLCFFG